MGQIAAIGAFMDSRAGPRLIVPRTSCEDAELLRALDAVAVHVGRLHRGRGGLRGGHGKCSESSRNSKRLHQEECVETMGSGVCRCALYTHINAKRRSGPHSYVTLVTILPYGRGPLLWGGALYGVASCPLPFSPGSVAQCFFDSAN